MLSRDERLNTAEFAAAFAGGHTLRHPLMQVRVFRRAPQMSERTDPQRQASQRQAPDKVRAAFVVPKKLGKATVRNLVRRRLRERYRLHPLRAELGEKLSHCDLIFMAAPALLTAGTAQIDEALAQLLRRAVRMGSDVKPNGR